MRKVLVCLLTLALVLGCMSVQAEGVLTPGTYTSTMTAMHGPMTVEVTVTDSAITSVEVVDQVETPGVTDPVFEKIPAAIVDNQTTAVDTITGATVSSRVLIAAVQDCLKQAGDTEGVFSKELEKAPAEGRDPLCRRHHRWRRRRGDWPRLSAHLTKARPSS